jgi:hypothetical protein
VTVNAAKPQAPPFTRRESANLRAGSSQEGPAFFFGRAGFSRAKATTDRDGSGVRTTTARIFPADGGGTNNAPNVRVGCRNRAGMCRVW